MSNLNASRVGPYSLLHRPSGAIRLFGTLQEAVAGLRVLGVSRLVDAASPEWLFHVGNRWSALCYPPQIGLHWQLTNVYGEIVTVDARDLSPSNRSAARRHFEVCARFRVDPVPGARGYRLRVYFRSPRTLAMLREAASRDDTEAPVRAARRVHAMPTAWHDLDRGNERNWKSQRRTQWKPRRRRDE